MIRKQLSFEPQQDAIVKRESERFGISESAFVRRLIDQYESETRDVAWANATALIGKYSSAVSDLAENHDRYLYGHDAR
ncbi:MAG: hypothetical protein JWN41_1453 [Thermoleophilia bacterium]|nr:hypothetical protein [Thermoleophilia bacterium]